MDKTTIDLLRHGEPQGGKRYRGQIDHPLSDLGWQQMQEKMPVNKPWQQILTSPLKRCAAFAEALSRDTDLPLSYEPEFIEMSFGEWEGQTAEALESADKPAFYAFYDDPIQNTPPGAEPLLAFQQRVIAAWQDLLVQYQQRHILLIAHAGTIRIILSHVLDMPVASALRIDVPYASLSRVDVHGSGSHAYTQLKFHAGQL
ncbi:histidine phosphatase family protein [Methylophaga thiooxydans]|uniref:Phosphoglycerate mutase family protein, putative n=1 Tax=Methylophaga thiooxydans DMS010 TaxID=637616 RepID=C0N3X5_9GAMM|nr:alpha-ribazole phosphatase family protein [Methylophaga thiooxydans]EEF80496.1 phosphoglycerate mutase family protein, putative [Methylophaga thiooxydans DMS010]